MEPKKTKWQSFWELVRFAALALIIVLPIRWFVFSSYVVSGNSMVPTFQNGNYLIIDKISYRMGNPQRNDVVVFRYPNDTTKFYIKRIIGLPGETIDVKSRENKTTITNQEHPDGLQLDQSFVKNIGGN